MSIYEIKVLKRENQQDVETTLEQYKGQVMLIVNTATGCGLTPQYEALEALYRKYKTDGFVVLDFPCNQFMEQAKGDDEEINSFCTLKYDTTFPRFKKIDVNGCNESPLYTFLKNAQSKREEGGNFFMKLMIGLSSKINGKSGNDKDIKWNFEKFLVNRQGDVVKRFAPTVSPNQIESFVAELLKKR